MDSRKAVRTILGERWARARQGTSCTRHDLYEFRYTAQDEPRPCRTGDHPTLNTSDFSSSCCLVNPTPAFRQMQPPRVEPISSPGGPDPDDQGALGPIMQSPGQWPNFSVVRCVSSVTTVSPPSWLISPLYCCQVPSFGHGLMHSENSTVGRPLARFLLAREASHLAGFISLHCPTDVGADTQPAVRNRYEWATVPGLLADSLTAGLHLVRAHLQGWPESTAIRFPASIAYVQGPTAPKKNFF